MNIENKSVRLVTFDLYDTLMELSPSRWDRLSNVLTARGIAHEPDALKAGDVIAEDYWTEMNTIRPIRDLGKAEQDNVRIEYMRRWLATADVPANDDLVVAIRHDYRAEYETQARTAVSGVIDGYRVFPDVNRAMQRLRAGGVLTAVISNADADVTEFCTRLQFAHEMDLIVTSAIVGYEKPDVRTYQAALEPLGVDAGDALHIGDQPRSDVVGALAAGMQAALIDRYARHKPEDIAVPVYIGLDELVDDVLAVNALVGVGA